MYVCMYVDWWPAAFLCNCYSAKKIFVVYWCWSKKWDELDTELICWYVFSAVHIILLPSQKPPSSHSLLKFVYVTSRLRHSLVGHPPPPPPPKKNPELTNLYFFKGAVITASHNSSFGQWPVLICYETWKIASELQNHSFVSSKYVFQGIISNVSNNKIEPWKTVRLTRFQKPQLQSTSIFFKFVHPCLFLYL